MTPNNPDDLAIISWDEMAGLLRSHGVHEDEIFKSGKSYKAGFCKGFEKGYLHKENEDDDDELTPAVGFEHEPDAEED